MMFHQILTPVAGNLLLSMIAAALPIATVLVALGIMRRPAWQASLAGLIVGLVIALLFWQFPASLAFNSVAAGAVFALWPVMWLVFNALLLYNIGSSPAASMPFATGCWCTCQMTGASSWW